MKTPKNNWYPAGFICFLALWLLPISVGAETITQAKMQSACTSAANSIKSYISKLDPASKSYLNLATSTTLISSPPITFGEIKSYFLVKAMTASTTIAGYCANTAATSTYLSLINTKDVALAVLNRLDALNTFYGNFRSLANNYNYLLNIWNDNQLGYPSGILARYNFNYERIMINRAIQSSTNPLASRFIIFNSAYFDPLFGQDSLTDLKSALNAFNSQLAGNANVINTINPAYPEALKSASRVIDRAAQENIFISSFYPAGYGALKDRYNAQASSTANSLKNDIDYKIRTLGGYVKRINGLSRLNNTVTSTLITKITSDSSTLADIKTSTIPGLSFAAVKDNEQLVNNLKINEIILPAVGLAISYDGKLKQLDDLTAIKSLITSSTIVNYIKANLEIADDAKLDLIVASTTNVDLTALGTVNQLDLAGAVQDTSSTKLQAFRSSTDAFSANLAKAAGKINAYRQQWWKLIDIAAAKGMAPTPALNNEIHVSHVLADFARRRSSYYAQARQIIDSRKDAMQKNQLKINNLLYVPAILGLPAITENVSTALDDYYADYVSTTIDYLALQAAVKNIKNAAIAEIYIPLQSMYYRFDNYYKKFDQLNAALNDPDFGLITQINALPTSNALRAGLISSSSEAATNLGDLYHNMSETVFGFVSITSQFNDYASVSFDKDTIKNNSLLATTSTLKTLISNEATTTKTFISIIGIINKLNFDLKRALK